MTATTAERQVVEDRPSLGGGRPRDPARAEAICEAALDLLAELGYERMTIEAVAARAGAGKATVYRRWTSKADLVMDALQEVKFIGPIADTGSLRGDLDRLCGNVTDEPGSRIFAIMRGLAAAIPHDPALMSAFNQRVVAPRRAAMTEIFARAIERGEMPPGRDVELLTAVIPALMIYRLLMGGDLPEPAFARRVVEELLLPAAVNRASTSQPDTDLEGSPDGR